MLAEIHDAGMCHTSSGAVIKLRLPARPRAPRYRCPKCDAQVTSEEIVELPGIYPVKCNSCGLITRVVVELSFFVVLS